MAQQINRRTFLKMVPASAVLASAGTTLGQAVVKEGPAVAPAAVAGMKPIQLLKPEKEGGKSVLAALWERKTIRNISAKPLPPQTLSNLLWAAFGVNRPKDASGRIGRTAASARNFQEIDLYVIMPEGIYLYEAEPHSLKPVVAGDHRSKVGGRGRDSSTVTAPINIVYVVDLARCGGGKAQESEAQKYFYVDTGLIGGNVYLFAASQGLAAWFHTPNAASLTETLKLRPEQRVLYTHTVGYPA